MPAADTTNTPPPSALRRFDAIDDITKMLAAFEADGGFIVGGMFPTETIQQIREAADRFADSIEPGAATQGEGEEGRSFAGTNTIRFSSLGTLSPAYFDMLNNELYERLADAILLPNCGSYWVNTGQVMYIGPGEPAQVLHRDANNWMQHQRALWPDVAEVTISAMIALEPITEELGATRVVPGSHRWPSLKRFASDDVRTVPAEMSPGDAFIYSGKVLHGGGANLTSDQWRRAMHLSFVVGWLTPEEANALDYTTEELASQTPRVQRLLGHRSYDARPHPGGGLWLKHVRAIEDQA